MRFLVVLFALALYLGYYSAYGDVSFELLGSSAQTYNQFIKNVRGALTVNSKPVYGIPVLVASASGSSQFLLVHLTNYNEQTITLGIDVVNVYVVAFKTGTQSYYLQDAPEEAYKNLFQGTTRNNLSYSGNYIGLETAAGVIRENVRLGFSEIGFAIENMYYYNAQSVAAAFLVLIQAISEASRFKYIQTKFSQNIETNFTPDPGFLSLENRWSDLSEQILIAQNNNGQFERPIEVRSVSNVPIIVSDVNSPVVKGIALLLNKKANLVYDHDIIVPSDRDTTDVTLSKISVVEDEIVAAETVTVNFDYKNTQRKSFLNGDGRFKVMEEHIAAI